MKDFSFQNKVVVVTGGAKGIGKCICDEFKKAGAILCTIDILDNPYFVGDISDENVLHTFAQKVISEYGKIDILVNNALPITKGIDDCSFEEFNYALKVGVTAPFYLSKLFLQDFVKRDSGYILNSASSAGFFPGPMFSSYYASKAYTVRMTEAVLEELRHKGSNVKVSMLCPGPVATEFLDRAGVSFAMRPQSSEYVAEYAVREMFGGARFICPSLPMKLGLAVCGFIPEMTAAVGARLIQSRREEL